MIGSGIALSAKLVLTGFCIGIGFWASRKLTGKIDTLLVLRDKEYLNALASK